MKQPEFWKHDTLHSKLLLPLAGLYRGMCKARRMLATSYRAELPIICIGNVTVGGAGKTPAALAVGRLLQDIGMRPAFLSRGYGGALHRATEVNDKHTAQEVGDEPLLLARVAPTIVSRDRIEGVQLIQRGSCNIVVMDDGLQNPSLIKDLSILVIDGAYGLGNGQVMPAGPLREPLEEALKRVNAVILIGEDATDLLPRIQDMHIFRAHIATEPLAHKAKAYVAFAGLAQPDKFFTTLASEGYNVLETVGFADHHPYSDEDLSALHAKAKDKGAKLITTEKDFARLKKNQRKAIETLPIRLVFEQEDALKNLLKAVKK